MSNGRDMKALKELFDVKIESLKELFKSEIANFDKAVKSAHDALNKRLEGMNEFRDALKDQTNKFVTREELKAPLSDIQWLRESKANLEGKADQKDVNRINMIAIVGIIIALLGIVISIITLFLKH